MCTVGKEKNNRAETGEARERGGEVQAEPASFDRDKEGEKKGDWRARRGYEKTQANAREKKWDLKKKKWSPRQPFGLQERMQRVETAVAARSDKMWRQ